MWASTVIGFAMGTLICSLPAMPAFRHRSDLPLLIFTLGTLGVPSLWLGIYGLLFQFKACVVADSERLQWRGAFGWRSAYWEEVRDYYERTSAKGRTFLTIETDAGKIALETSGWNRLPELRERVYAQARRTRAKAWGSLGCRPEEDWPRIFTYDERSNRRYLWGLRGALGFLLISPVLIWVSKFGEMRFQPGWQRTLVAPAVLELLMILYAMVFSSIVRKHRDALHRLNERIIVDWNGITFEDGFRRVKVAWEDIRAWREGSKSRGPLKCALFMVETEAGNFDFTSCLQDANTLREMITLRTGRRLDPGVDVDALYALNSLVVDQRIYTYRTRTNRAMVFLATTLACSLLLPVVLFDKPLEFARILLLILFDGGLWAWAVIAWGRYRVARLETDSRGITERGLLGERRLEWEDVRSYSLHPEGMVGYGEVRGTTERVRFGLTIAHIDQLKAEVVQRAVQSANQRWNEPRRDD